MIEFSCFKRKLFSEITEIPIFFQQKHLPSLDGLRAFSVFYVIAFHWYLGWAHDAEKDIYLPDMVQSALQEGILGVHFFFILSGFLITSLLLKEKIVHQAISFKNFYFRRAFRILPIAILYLLVVIVLNVIFDKDVKANNIIFPLFFAENLDINYHYYTAHYWSLAVEEQFYLFFPFMITLKILNYYRVALILLIIAPAVHYIFTHHCPGNPFLRHVLHFVNIILNRGLLSILIGTFLSIVLFKFKFTIQINKYLYSILQILVLYLVLFFHKRHWIGNVNILLSDIFIAIFLFSLLVNKDSLFYKLLNTSLFKWVGVLSYSLYIWQEPFCAFQPWKDSFPYGGSMLSNLPILMLVAFLSYNYFEKPFLKLKERFK